MRVAEIVGDESQNAGFRREYRLPELVAREQVGTIRVLCPAAPIASPSRTAVASLRAARGNKSPQSFRILHCDTMDLSVLVHAVVAIRAARSCHISSRRIRMGMRVASREALEKRLSPRLHHQAT